MSLLSLNLNEVIPPPYKYTAKSGNESHPDYYEKLSAYAILLLLIDRPCSMTCSTIKEFGTEKEEKPQILYRGFTMYPGDLSIKVADTPLVQGNTAEYKSTQDIEPGVYMSTNQQMIRVYSGAGLSDTRLRRNCLTYKGTRGLENFVILPSVGIECTIDTDGLDIQRPNIAQGYSWVYNNGYQGDEWIAKEVPPENFTITRLVLSTGYNDPQKIEIPVARDDRVALEIAIKAILRGFQDAEEEATQFIEFLKSLTRKERFNQFVMERKWKEFQEKNLV